MADKKILLPNEWSEHSVQGRKHTERTSRPVNAYHTADAHKAAILACVGQAQAATTIAGIRAAVTEYMTQVNRMLFGD